MEIRNLSTRISRDIIKKNIDNKFFNERVVRSIIEMAARVTAIEKFLTRNKILRKRVIDREVSKIKQGLARNILHDFKHERSKKSLQKICI